MAEGDVLAAVIPASENSFNLGMGLFSTTDTSLFDSYVDDLIANNIFLLRVDIPDYQNVAKLAQSKDAVTRAIAKRMKIIWGVNSNKGNNPAYELTAANWGDFEAAVLDAAAWAEANGVYEFQLGNELEASIDGTTLTSAQLIINLKALATAVQAVYTIGNISYTCSNSHINNWVVATRGDIDFLASNIYRGSMTSSLWQSQINQLVAGFGIDHTYITEFSLSPISLDTYSTNEETQLIDLEYILNYIKNSGINRACFFCYINESFGARKANGNYRKLWKILKTTNSIIPVLSSQRITANDIWLMSSGKDGQVYTVHIEEAP